MRDIRALLADDRGSSPVEFVLVGALLTLLTLGVLQLGLAVYVRNVVHDAAVEGALHQFVDPRMLAEPLLVELPHLAEAAVPQVQPPVAGEHADRLEQIVERRRPHSQQRIAGRRQADLLGLGAG